MIKKYVIFVFLFCVILINAQKNDSIYVKIKEDLDTINTYDSKLSYLITKGDYYLEKDLDRSILYFKEAQNLVLDTDSVQQAKILRFLGSVAYRKGDYTESLMYYMDAKKVYRSLKDTLSVADLFLREGRVYKYLNENKRAIENYRKSISLAISIKDSTLLGRCYTSMGGSFRRIRKIDSSLHYYNKALQIFRKTKNELRLSNVNNDMAILYAFQNRYDKSLQVHLNNIDFIKKNHSKRNVGITYFNIGYSYFKLKKDKKSLAYLDSSEVIAKEEGFKYRLSKVADIKSKIYYRIKEYDKAYAFQVLYKKYSDSIFNLKKQKQIKELELKREFEVKKRDLEILANKKELELRSYVLTTILILFFTIIIGLLLWRDYKARAKRIKDKFEKEKLKKEVLAQKIKVSESELKGLIADNTMRLEFIKHLSSQIKEDKNESNSDEVKHYANGLLLKLQNQIGTENKLTSLQDKINEVNQGFDKIIIDKFPELTKTEREVCTFLRLNLSIKEIASIRNSSIDSIKSLRYRIRKKMKVPKNQELEHFIQSL
ncbi:tetratricopeptide repeat protein [uncultured Tenacibaculum sp.]|uniref:tetratricopeptide repeat protein n=1 Tax=uncultured Tenacibaculum sp. TaxID=174713 RepID=UPI00262D2702|nr:tetratricopeptide repeat protein [uncultured Tenacibaculum sp.]